MRKKIFKNKALKLLMSLLTAVLISVSAMTPAMAAPLEVAASEAVAEMEVSTMEEDISEAEEKTEEVAEEETEEVTETEEETSTEETESMEEAESEEATESAEESEPADEAEHGEISETESIAEEQETEEPAEKEPEKDIYFTEGFNADDYSWLDFSSKRLLVMTWDESIFVDRDAVISSFDGVHLLQFEDAETTMKAYAYYLGKAAIVEPDSVVTVCSPEEMMTGFSNPIAEIEREGIYPKGSYDIALIDTGANSANVTGAVSVIGDSVSDDNGHGTVMADFIAQENPNASILSIKALGSDGRGDISAVYAAVEYAISQNVKIINLSLSANASVSNSVLSEAVRKAVSCGIVVVGAAGNNGTDAGWFIPANIDAALICGSCDENGAKLAASNFGNSVDYNVVSSSTSEAAARMSGFISRNQLSGIASELNKGFIFETGYAPEEAEPEESITPDGKEYTMVAVGNDMFTAAASGTFWADPNFGEGDILYYGSIGGTQVPAYCIDHGLPCPEGTYNSSSSVSNQLGYVMRYGYPNNQWGLSWHEAQYLTQCAVFGIMGVPLYDISDGMMPCSWIYDQIWGAGHFYIAENLIAQARANASSSDAAYVTFWNPNNGYSQRVVTPSLTGKLSISKTVSAGAGTLTISKDTKGAGSDADAEFTFTIKVKNESGTVQTTKFNYTGSKTGTISGNGGTVKLKSGQSITVSGIPAGYSYTVSETADADYIQTPASGTYSGTIPAVPSGQAFEFTVTFSTGGSYGYTGSKSGTISSGGTISLKNGQSVTISGIPAGATYRVTEKETEGYTADKTTASGSISAGSTASAKFINTYNPAAEKAEFSNERKSSSLTVTKTTSATGECLEQLKGNNMYSQDFSDAEFTVKIFDKNTGTWGTEKKYVTGKDGKFTIDNLYSGDTVSVTETKAPKGYLIPSQPAQTLKLAQGSNALTFKDDPTFDPATPTVYKARYENGKIIAGDPVKDAVFKVEYFDNINREGTAKRTWYFITDAEGTFLYQPECLAEGYESDALYVDKFGIYEMPLGSVRMTEVKSPAGFLKYAGTLEGTITQNAESGLAEFTWVTPETSEVKPDGGTILLGERELVIAVDKVDRGTGRSLPGAVLQLKQGNTVLKEWTTDGSVMQIRNILSAGQTYQIHEAGAPKGYKTAPDIIFAIDEEGNINVISADIDTFVTAEGYLGVKMEDTEMIMLPLTGSTGGLWMILTGAGLLAAGTTAWFMTRRRKISLKRAGRKIVCAIAVIISAAALTVPAYAAGNIEVVRKGAEVKTYKAYTLMEGSYEEGKLWNIRLAEGIPEKTWEMIGVPEEFLGNGQLLASWLSVKLESDTDGSFVRMLADHVTRAEEPSHVFRSGETISVTDGYYLVVSDDSYPMLFLTGGGETQSIYEKLIPKDYPKTGDTRKMLPYVLCATAGAAGIAAGIIFISSSGRKKEDEE